MRFIRRIVRGAVARFRTLMTDPVNFVPLMCMKLWWRLQSVDGSGKK
jgi:hypothetical protein